MEIILDKRLIPANSRTGWVKSYPKCDAPNLVDGELKSVVSHFANLQFEPKGDRVRQLVYGDTFRVLEENEGFSFGFSNFDGYVGYIQKDKLKKQIRQTTHWVSSIATHIYAQPDIKKKCLGSLSFGSQLEIVNDEKNFCETIDGGFIPRQHLRERKNFYSDPVMVAQLFLGTPYLWGGNTCWGIDCSGLIQAAFASEDIWLPRDAYQQEKFCVDVGISLGNFEALKAGESVWKTVGNEGEHLQQEDHGRAIGNAHATRTLADRATECRASAAISAPAHPFALSDTHQTPGTAALPYASRWLHC